jgi:hypothetical protein
MGEWDIASYNLTQCYEFAAQNLPDCDCLLDKIRQENRFVAYRRVKLSRIENKIEHVKSLHSFMTSQPGFKIKKQMHKKPKIKQE